MTTERTSRVDDQAAPADAEVRYGTTTGRWIMLASILGSSVAALDATVVNVALPAIGEDLGAGFSALQWTLNGYLLTLSALILTGGALGDRYGRRRIFVVGVVWFTAASLLCGVALNVPMLVAARVLQGVGGALLTPASLAIIQASFHPADRARAVGTWSGLGGIATAIGPFLGGYLVDAWSWRFIFLLNVPLAFAVVPIALRHVPETIDATSACRPDVLGAVAGAAGLAGLTFALIEAPGRSITSPAVLVAAAVGLAGLVTFVLVERRGSHPMLPLDIFSSRQFTSANLVTFVVYGALGGIFFLLVVELQRVVGYSPLQAGAATLPITVLMLAFSARAGQLAQRIGPRLPMTAGPLVMAIGLLLMTRIDAGGTYPTTVLPAVVVFGLGLCLTVAPLTATVLAAADARHAGVASGVNNAVARVAGLVAVAALPVVAGLTGDDYQNAAAFASGFRVAVIVSAGLAAAGGVLSWFEISNDVLPSAAAGAPAPLRPRRSAASASPPRARRPQLGVARTASPRVRIARRLPATRRA